MKPTRFLGFVLLPAILLLSCSSNTAPQGVGGGTLCPGLAVDCPAGTLDFCLPGDVPVSACCYATPDGRHVPIGLCPAPDGGNGGTCAGCITPDLRCLPGNSVDACGVSGAPCASCGRGNGTAACTNGACVEPVTCSGYYLDCDGDATNGCETPMTDPNNCGACGNVCDGGTCEESCVPGMGCSFACH